MECRKSSAKIEFSSQPFSTGLVYQNWRSNIIAKGETFMIKNRVQISSVIISLGLMYQSMAQETPPATTPSAAEYPSAEAAQSVLNYYFNGTQMGPLLVKAESCLKVEMTKGPQQYTCLEPIAESVKKGSRVTAVLTFMTPNNTSFDDVSVQILHEGTVRSTKDYQIPASLRYRVLATDTFTKPGKWEIKVSRAGTELKSLSYNVQ
jgi:hypothetical protein